MINRFLILRWNKIFQADNCVFRESSQHRRAAPRRPIGGGMLVQWKFKLNLSSAAAHKESKSLGRCNALFSYTFSPSLFACFWIFFVNALMLFRVQLLSAFAMDHFTTDWCYKRRIRFTQESDKHTQDEGYHGNHQELLCWRQFIFMFHNLWMS